MLTQLLLSPSPARSICPQVWLVIVWAILAVIVGAASGARGRSTAGWFLLALVLSPLIAGLFLLILPDLRTHRLLEEIAPGKATAVDDAALYFAVHGKPPPDRYSLVVSRMIVGILIVAALLVIIYLNVASKGG